MNTSPDQVFPNFELLPPTVDLCTLFTINSSQIVVTTQSIDPYFMCILCKNLVSPHPRGPLECSQCHSVFCESCIDKFVTSNIVNNSGKSASSSASDMRALISCPRGCQDLHVQKLHTFALNKLNQIPLKCPYQSEGCEEVMPYQDLIEHATTKCG